VEETDSSNLTLIFIFLSFFFSGFFSASEVALLSISEAKARSLKDEKKRGSSSLLWLKNHPEKLIITILIGNNLVNISASMLAAIWVENKFGSKFLSIATGIFTLLVLIFGEILPKTFAQKNAKKFALLAAPLLRNLEKILFPLVWTLEKITSLSQNKTKKSLTEQELESELLALAEIGEEEGVLKRGEKEIIENVLEFSDTKVEEVMTSRLKIDALNENSTLEKAIEYIISHSHSRIPVYRDNIDQITAIVTIRDLLAFSKQFKHQKKLSELDLPKPFSIPHTCKISQALKDFQKNKVQIAVVFDENGGVDGIVTLEDLVEEIFGEIEDEYDAKEIVIKNVAKNSWQVKASATCGDFLEKTGLTLDQDENKKIALLILEKLGRFPKIGEKVNLKEAEIFVEKMKDQKIEKVRILRKITN